MASSVFVNDITLIVGKKFVHTTAASLARFKKGWRSGEGEAELAVEPGTLMELWEVLKSCVAHDRIIIMQAANTGLTEGSTPKGTYDRPVVVINTLRLSDIHLLQEGHQIISHPGGTLYELEKRLKPFGRQPHSVIGSSCLGASILGGVCNNSGGALVQRGPAYTEMALFAQKTADGKIELINHLGLDLGESPEEILGRLDRGEVGDGDIIKTKARASDNGYEARVRNIDATTPARFNADPRTLHEASGCAGKLAVFAVRLDTFPQKTGEQVYYIGTHSTKELANLRRALLSAPGPLPVSAEYMHRDIFDATLKYGKDTFLFIDWLGTDWLPFIFKTKGQVDGFLEKFKFLPSHFSDRALQFLFSIFPNPLPKRVMSFREKYEHHLILKVEGEACSATEELLKGVIGETGWFLCDEAEAKKAMLHRFAAAGAAARLGVVNENHVEDIIALDIALRRNDAEWFETLPEDIEGDLVGKFYYGHFLCHVFHQDYAVKKGADVNKIKAKMLALLDKRQAEYPAEHNVGHLYEAKPALAAFYKSLDPTNSFNPGIGKTSKQKTST